MISLRQIVRISAVAMLVTALSLTNSFSQEQKGTIRAGSRDDLLAKLPVSVSYLMPDFRQSTVVYLNGANASGVLNVCLVDNSIRFIDEKGDTLRLVNADAVRHVMCGDTLLLQRNGKFNKVVSIYGNISLCVTKDFSFSEPEDDSGYAGMPATSTAKQARVRSIDYSRNYGSEVDIPWELKIRWLLDDGNRTYVPGKSVFMKLFPEIKDQIKTYLKKEPVNFRNGEDLVRLFQYCAETENK